MTLTPRQPVPKLHFRVVEVDSIPGCDSTVGGANYYACRDGKYSIPFDHSENTILILKSLSEEGKLKTTRHEKAEAILMAMFPELDYDSAHLLTNRLDQIYGNCFSKNL